MSKKLNWLTVTAVAVGLSVAGNAFATNGYFTHGTGTKNKAMAGSGIALPEDSIDITNNPAVAPFVGDQLIVGAALFSPIRKYETSDSMLNGQMGAFTIGPNKITSDSEYFVIPHIAKSWQLDNGHAWALAFYGRGGMNTDWNDPNASATSYLCGGNPQAMEPPATGQGPYCAGPAGVDLMQAFLAVNYSAKVNDNFAGGIGPVLAVQRFEAKGVGTFGLITKTCVDGFDPATQSCGGNPTSLSDNGYDTSVGFGFAGGIWWGMTDRFSLGLAYQSEMSMDEFSKYSDLFAGGGGFDIPSSIKAGFSFVASDALRVNFDIEHTAFGDIDSIANPMQNMVGCPVLPFGGTDLESCLGGANGPGFGWEDMTTYKLGFEWGINKGNVLRFGYSYGEQPIQSADVLFNILAPGVMEQHFTLGWTHVRPSGNAWNFSFMYAPENSVTGPSFFDPSPQTIEIKMSQLEFEVSYRFGGGQ